MKLTKYRIVRDSCYRFEVQRWRIWLPVWLLVEFNTYSSIAEAKKRIGGLKREVVYTEKLYK
jgi:hypothetical protein